jgi:hypothetical protein
MNFGPPESTETPQGPSCRRLPPPEPFPAFQPPTAAPPQLQSIPFTFLYNWVPNVGRPAPHASHFPIRLRCVPNFEVNPTLKPPIFFIYRSTNPHLHHAWMDIDGEGPQRWPPAVTAVWSSGVACIAVASATYSVAAALVRPLSPGIDVFQIVATRSALSLGFSAAAYRGSGQTGPFFGSPRNIPLLAMRGLVGAAAMVRTTAFLSAACSPSTSFSPILPSFLRT